MEHSTVEFCLDMTKLGKPKTPEAGMYSLPPLDSNEQGRNHLPQPAPRQPAACAAWESSANKPHVSSSLFFSPVLPVYLIEVFCQSSITTLPSLNKHSNEKEEMGKGRK